MNLIKALDAESSHLCDWLFGPAAFWLQNAICLKRMGNDERGILGWDEWDWSLWQIRWKMLESSTWFCLTGFAAALQLFALNWESAGNSANKMKNFHEGKWRKYDGKFPFWMLPFVSTKLCVFASSSNKSGMERKENGMVHPTIKICVENT